MIWYDILYWWWREEGMRETKQIGNKYIYIFYSD